MLELPTSHQMQHVIFLHYVLNLAIATFSPTAQLDDAKTNRTLLAETENSDIEHEMKHEILPRKGSQHQKTRFEINLFHFKKKVK